jgi:hypothetical protein
VQPGVSEVTRDFRQVSRFDGRLMTWKVINALAPDPVLDFEVYKSGQTEVLRLTVLRDAALLVLDLAPARVEPPTPGYGGYYVLQRTSSEATMHTSGEDWPFFGEPGNWIEVKTESFSRFATQAASNAVSKGKVRPMQKVASIDYRFSLPRSSEGHRFEYEFLDGDANVVDSASGLNIASGGGSDLTRDEGESVLDFCDRVGFAARVAALGEAARNVDLIDLSVAAMESRYGARFASGAVAAGVAARTTKSPMAIAASGTLGMAFGDVMQDLAAQFELAHQTALGNHAHNMAEMHCMADNWDGTEFWDWLIDGLTDNPKLINVPPFGYSYQLQCTEWSAAMEDFNEIADGEFELIYNAPKCVRMTAAWVPT